MAKEVVFLSGARTAFGTFCGSLKEKTATELAVVASSEAIRRAGIEPKELDHVIMGNVVQSSADAPYLARHVGLRAGVPFETPAVTVNRLCASGFQSIVMGARQILLGEADMVLAGGTESMSQAPHVIRGARWGIPFRGGELEDTLWQALYDRYPDMPMAITAENLAERYGITREEADRFAYESQMKAKEGWESGRLSEEIAPVELKDRKGNVTEFKQDEHPRPGTSLESLARLKPVFKADGVITAGNASGICDGASAMVLASAEKAEERGLKPIGRLISWAVCGVDPTVMGIGPVPSSKKALERAGLGLDDMDLIEINEAFAPQYLAVEKELGLDRSKVNVNGGAIAIGHPVGTSGNRLTLTILHELRRRGGRFGLAGACIGGGQGMSLVVEALS